MDHAKALLVYPPGDISHLRHPYDGPPLGVPQLCGYLRRRGLFVKGVDLNLVHRSRRGIALHNTIRERLNLPYEGERPLAGRQSLDRIIRDALSTTDDSSMRPYLHRLESIVDAHGIRVLGFSILYPRQLHACIALARRLKEKPSAPRVIAGGGLVTKFVDKLARTGSVFDAFIVGDGEKPLYDYLRGRPLPETPNLYYRRGDGYVFSGKRFQASADCFAEPDFRGWSRRKYFNVKLGYGCPWGKCAFCTYPREDRRCSTTDPERAVSMLRSLRRRYGVSYFKIIDDSLTPRFLSEFSRELIRQKANLNWWCFLALFPSLSRARIQRMARAGCTAVSIGLESMSERVLRLIDKPQKSPQWSIQVMTWLKEAGLDVHAQIIFGFPTETREEAMETANFLFHRGDLYDSERIHCFSLEKDTPIFRDPGKYGVTSIDRTDARSSWRSDRMTYSYEVEKGMSRDEAAEFTERVRNRLARDRERFSPMFARVVRAIRGIRGSRNGGGRGLRG